MDTEPKTGLRPCPFCGSGDADVLETESGIAGLRGHRYCCCGGCGSQTGLYNTRKEARQAWNRRKKEAGRPRAR